MEDRSRYSIGNRERGVTFGAERQEDQETGGEYWGTGRKKEPLLNWETGRQGDRGRYTCLGDSKTRRQKVIIGMRG